MNTVEQKRMDAFTSWLEKEDKISVPEHLLATSALFAIDEEGDSNVSGQNTIAIGNYAQQESEKGVQLNQAVKAGDKDEIVNLLTESTGNAVASILGLAQSRSGWNPLDPDNSNNAEGFQKFVQMILKVPFFTVTQSERTTVHYEESNYNSLIEKVVDLYDGVSSSNRSKIESSIVNLAKACTSRVNTSNTKTLFVQNTMAAPGKNIVVGLQQTFMMMERSHRSGKGAPKDQFKTEITVNVMELTFEGNVWTRAAAEKLADNFVKSWDDWLSGTTTPPEQKSIEFCFGEPEAVE